MDEFEQKLHRTWVQALVEFGLSSLGSVAIDTKLTVATHEYENFNEWVSIPHALVLDVPIPHYAFIKKNEDTVKRTLRGVCQGHLYESSGKKVDVNGLDVEFRVALVELEEYN